MLRHPLGCNLVSLLGIRLITLLWQVVVVVDILLAVVVAQGDYFLPLFLYLQVRRIRSR
jgi:hypothetical protein